MDFFDKKNKIISFPDMEINIYSMRFSLNIILLHAVVVLYVYSCVLNGPDRTGRAGDAIVSINCFAYVKH